MYTLKIKKELENLKEEFEFENSIIEKIYKLEIKESEEEVELILHNDIEKQQDIGVINELELAFNKVKFKKETSEILNINEIQKKWKEIKKELVFKRQDTDVISLLMMISKFFENKESLSNILKNHSYIQLLTFFYKNKDKEGEINLQINNLFSRDVVDFVVTFKKDDDNEYIIHGTPPLSFGTTNYSIKVKNHLKIKAGSLFYPKLEISGKFVYKEVLESMKIELIMTSREDMKYKKTIEILKEETSV